MKEEKIILKKLLNCAYVIIAILAINTLIVLIGVIGKGGENKSTKSSTKSPSPQTQQQGNDEYDVSMMNTVDVDEIVKLYKADKKSVIYMGRATCGYCVQFLPTLQKAQKEYGYKTNYLDITTASESDVNELKKIDNKDEFLGKNYGATPMVIIVGKGKIIDTWLGYSEYEQFAQFLEKNGFKK